MKRAVLALTLLLPVAAVSGAPLSEGLRFYASFDSGAAPTYAFGSPKLRGLAEGAGTVEGRVGGALRLPDSQAATAVTFAGPGNLQRPRGTVAFWVRSSWDGGGGDAKHFIFSMGGFRIYADRAKGVLTVMTGTGRLEGWRWSYSPSARVADWRAGQWHHVAVTWDGAAQHKSLWLDGRPVGEAESKWIPHKESGRDFTFGLGWRAPADYDELAVWERELSAGEIASLAAYPEAAARELASLPMPEVTRWPVNVGLHSWIGRATESIVAPGEPVLLEIPVSNPGHENVTVRLDFTLLDFHERELASQHRQMQLAPGAEEKVEVTVSADVPGVFKLRCHVKLENFEGVRDVASFGVVPEPDANEPDEDSFFGSHPEAGRGGYIEQAGRLGVKWARCHDMIQATRWSRVQPTEDDWAFQGETGVDRCIAAGMNVLGVFFATPPWAVDTTVGSPSGNYRAGPPREMSEYLEYVRRVMERYRGRIRCWEVWNEPDASNFWKGTARDYVELLRETCSVAKATDPDCVIIGGGGLHPSQREWIEAAAEAGMLDWCDWLSYHAYFSADSPTDEVLDTVRYFEDLLARHGKADIPLVCTEGGVTDTTFYEGLDFEELPPERVRPPMSWRRGACRLVQVAALEMSEGVKKRFYYYHKPPPVARAYFDYSALEVTGAPRPKLMAWSAMERRLRGLSFARRVDADGWRAVVFAGAGRSVAVAWADDDTRVTLPYALPDGATLTDIMGVAIPPPEAGRLTLTDEPVYISAPVASSKLLPAP
ncbi:MAG: hypothetical protein J7M38_14620 [Armatimonadetes bacterium]|nr:hypothetical protein [Armatimonadota bacterium]